MKPLLLGALLTLPPCTTCRAPSIAVEPGAEPTIIVLGDDTRVEVPPFLCDVCGADAVAISPGTAPIRQPDFFDLALSAGEPSRMWCAEHWRQSWRRK